MFNGGRNFPQRIKGIIFARRFTCSRSSQLQTVLNMRIQGEDGASDLREHISSARNQKPVGKFTVTHSVQQTRRSAMPRFTLVASLILLMTDCAFAQYGQEPDPMQCQQIRHAAAQYGFAAARQHALANYGPEAVKMGDKCFAKSQRAAQASITG